MIMKNKIICPLRQANAEICKAAISSLMINKKYCISSVYDRCALFWVIQGKNGGDRNVPEL